MKIRLSINSDVDDDDEERAELVASIVQEESRKFTSALADRLEAEGVTDVEFLSIEDSEDEPED
jgi:hypothetical protein